MGIQLSKPLPPAPTPTNGVRPPNDFLTWREMQRQLEEAGLGMESVPSAIRPNSLESASSSETRNAEQARIHRYDPTQIPVHHHKHQHQKKKKQQQQQQQKHGRTTLKLGVTWTKDRPLTVLVPHHHLENMPPAHDRLAFAIPESAAQLEQLNARQRRALLALMECELRRHRCTSVPPAASLGSGTPNEPMGGEEEEEMMADELVDPAFGEAVTSGVFRSPTKGQQVDGAHVLPGRTTSFSIPSPPRKISDVGHLANTDGWYTNDRSLALLLESGDAVEAERLARTHGTWRTSVVAAMLVDGFVDLSALDPLLSPPERRLLLTVRRRHSATRAAERSNCSAESSPSACTTTTKQVAEAIPPTAAAPQRRPSDDHDDFFFDEISPPAPVATPGHASVTVEPSRTTAERLRQLLLGSSFLMMEEERPHSAACTWCPDTEAALVDALVEEVWAETTSGPLLFGAVGLPCLAAAVQCSSAHGHRPVQHRLDALASNSGGGGAGHVVEELVVGLCSHVARATSSSGAEAGSATARRRGDVEAALVALAALCRDLRSSYASDVLRHVPAALLFDSDTAGTPLQAMLHASPAAALSWMECAVYAGVYHTTGSTAVCLAEQLAALLCGTTTAVPGVPAAERARSSFTQRPSFASLARRSTSVAALLLPANARAGGSSNRDEAVGSTSWCSSGSSTSSASVGGVGLNGATTHPLASISASFRLATRFDVESGCAAAFDAPSVTDRRLKEEPWKTTTTTRFATPRCRRPAPTGDGHGGEHEDLDVVDEDDQMESNGSGEAANQKCAVSSVEQWVEWVGIAAEAAANSASVAAPTGPTLLHVTLGYLIALSWREGHRTRALALEAHYPDIAAVSRVVLHWMATQEGRPSSSTNDKSSAAAACALPPENTFSVHATLARVLCRWPRLSRWLHVTEFAADGHLSGVVAAAALALGRPAGVPSHQLTHDEQQTQASAAAVPWRLILRGLFTASQQHRDATDHAPRRYGSRGAAGGGPACPFATYARSVDPSRGGNGCVCACAAGV